MLCFKACFKGNLTLGNYATGPATTGSGTRQTVSHESQSVQTAPKKNGEAAPACRQNVDFVRQKESETRLELRPISYCQSCPHTNRTQNRATLRSTPTRFPRRCPSMASRSTALVRYRRTVPASVAARAAQVLNFPTRQFALADCWPRATTTTTTMNSTS